ncbi:MAG: PaaI family thioesterase [Parvibaculum sp.]|nr:PaaI family thioesterase [Parvibaculum sp.]
MSSRQVDTSGFGAYAGPVLRNDQGAFTFEIADHHLNGADRLHGGMMMTLAAIVLGAVAKETATEKSPGATVRPLSLNCDFLSAGEKGDTVEGRAEVTRATRTVLFISGELRAGTRMLMTATGVYAIGGVEKA